MTTISTPAPRSIKAEFLKAEYATLRQEIKETKTRMFKLAGLSVIGLPSAYYVAHVQNVNVLILSLPLLICLLVLLYMSESRALMRCGRYIRTVLEPEIQTRSGEPPIGWETWLEEKGHGQGDRRLVDKLLTGFFYVIWLFYYVASVSLAVNLAHEKYQMVGVALVLGGYFAIGIVFCAVLLWAFRSSTSTST